MQSVKRIEMIANAFELDKILHGLEQAGIQGHAVIHNVSGKGLRGGFEDLDATLEDNVYILAFCEPEQLESVITTVRPLLNRFGGTCYISDAMEIRSIKCTAS